MQNQWSYAQFLLALCEIEVERRWSQRLKRALNEAQFPSAKTLSTFDWSHLDGFNPAPLMQLATDSGWLKRAENCLIFGPSGVGKPTSLVHAYSHDFGARFSQTSASDSHKTSAPLLT